jgi:hypothetical protein
MGGRRRLHVQRQNRGTSLLSALTHAPEFRVVDRPKAAYDRQTQREVCAHA